MRKIAAVLIALAIAAAALPALLGALAQDRINSLAEEASSGHFFQVSITGYQRGWRNSRALLTVALSERYRAILEGPFSRGSRAPGMLPQLQDLLDFELQLAAEIVHGPLLTRGGVGLGLADALVRVDPAGLDELLAVLGTQSPGEVVARIGIGNVSQLRWAIPPMTYADEDGRFASSGLAGEGTYDVARQRLATQTQLGSLELSGPRAAINVEDFTLSGDRTAIATGIWSGTWEAGLGRLSVSGADNAPIATLDNLSVRSRNEVDESGDLIHTNIEVTADSVEGTMDGDAQNISDVSLNVAVRNLDLAATLDYQEALFDLVGMDVAATDPTALFAQLQPVIYDFLAAEPEIETGPLSFNFNGGTLQARIFLGIDNEMLPAEPAFSLMDTALWARLASIEAELDVDRNIAERIAVRIMTSQSAMPTGMPAEVPAEILRAQARGTLVSLVAQGMLEETESGYRFRGSYENGVVEVNGQVVPIGPGAQGNF